jgi:hypothetical protein
MLKWMRMELPPLAHPGYPEMTSIALFLYSFSLTNPAAYTNTRIIQAHVYTIDDINTNFFVIFIWEMLCFQDKTTTYRNKRKEEKTSEREKSRWWRYRGGLGA